MKHKIIHILFFILTFSFVKIKAQNVAYTPDYIKTLTYQWKGERLADGRPKVSDAILARLKNLSMEEAWGFLRSKGYNNQYEGDWQIIHPDIPMTGRVVTAQYMPLRPDYKNVVQRQGAVEKRDTIGKDNSWPIDILQLGDVYVADGYDRIINNPIIGSNLGNAIYNNSKNGVIFYGGVRDLEGLREIKGFNGWIRGHDPSSSSDRMLSSINAPIRIGRAIVLPGDVVLANRNGTIFIPAYLVDELVLSSEVVALQDQFGFQRLREKKYTPGQIDIKWTEEMNNDFKNWIDSYPDNKLPMTRKEINDYLNAHK